jgi:hypothetical protein
MLAEFLLDELKKQIGDRLLRIPSPPVARPPRARLRT